MKTDILFKAAFILLLSTLSVMPAHSQQKKTAAKTPVKKTVTANKISPAAKPKPSVNKPTAKNKAVTPAKKVISQPVDLLVQIPVNSVTAITSREKEMINEINTLRSDPSAYCACINKYLEKNDPDESVKSAAGELVALLKKMKPLTPLAIDYKMYNDARQHGLLLCKKNELEHSSLPYAENLSLGYQNIRDAIIDLLIDDGTPDRGHRNNLLNGKIKSVAV